MSEPAKEGSTPGRKPVGRVCAPAGLFALLAVLLAMGFERVGLLASCGAWVRGGFAGMGLAGLAPVGLPLVWITLGLSGFGLSVAVLDSPQLWRRVVLGLAAGVVTVAWAPVLATLGYDLPVVPLLVGMIWAWFCSTLYAQQHRMPCDAPPPAKPAIIDPAT
jgi:hypothetical protein